MHRLLVFGFVFLLLAAVFTDSPYPVTPSTMVHWEATADDEEEEIEPHEQVRTHNDQLVDIGTIVPGFGGMYLDPEDPDVLNVYMLDTEDEAQLAEVERLLRLEFPDGVPARVRAIQGDYSIVQLWGWYHDAVYAVLQSEYRDSWTSNDLAEHSNRIRISIDDEDAIPHVERIILESVEGLPAGAVRVVYGERLKFRGLLDDDDEYEAAEEPSSNSEPEPEPPTNKTVRDKFRPSIGGIQTRGHGQGICTQGFNAIRGNKYGVVVNSHCTSSLFDMESTVFYEPKQIRWAVDCCRIQGGAGLGLGRTHYGHV